MKIDDYEIIKKIETGGMGSVYLVKKDKKEYALKIEKILESEVKKDLSSPIWREIDFATNFANLYPDQFMQLYDHDIINDCNHHQEYTGNKKEKKEYMENRIKSKYCSRKIYSLIDIELRKLIPKLKNQNEIYSIIIQISYAIYLMNKHGYTHNDLHTGNIGIIYTNKKYLKIFDEDIPTYGYQVNVIDYGMILHSHFKLKDKDMYGYNENILYEESIKGELKKCLSRLLFDHSIIRDIFNNNNTFNTHFNELRDKFYDSNKGKVLQSITTNKDDVFYLYIMINPLDWEKLFLGKDFKKYVPIHKLLQTDDWIFILENTPIEKPENIKDIILYFMMKIN
jgi:serine/threonine protein kinase